MTLEAPQLSTTRSDGQVWRVGYRPDPWAWPSWQYATNGRFTGRWDDADGNFRTIYAGAHLLGCLLEVLACFRPDPELAAQLTDIVDDDPSGPHPTSQPGAVPRSWLKPRAAASAELNGAYAAVTNTHSVAHLRPAFLHRAHELGLDDLDAATLKDARPRALTQEVATYIYETTDLDGVQFHSRHGDDHTLWAIFERPGDPDISPRLHRPVSHDLTADHPEIQEAFRIHHLNWTND